MGGVAVALCVWLLVRWLAALEVSGVVVVLLCLRWRNRSLPKRAHIGLCFVEVRVGLSGVLVLGVVVVVVDVAGVVVVVGAEAEVVVVLALLSVARGRCVLAKKLARSGVQAGGCGGGGGRYPGLKKALTLAWVTRGFFCLGCCGWKVKRWVCSWWVVVVAGCVLLVLVVARAFFLIFCTLFFHAVLSSAAACRSLQLVSLTSMRMSPFCSLSKITRRVSLICRGSPLLLFFMRIM